jgi:hypothetical protein
MVILWMQLPEVARNHRHSSENGQPGQNREINSLEELDAACIALDWTDTLVKCLDSVPGFRDTVLTTLVVTPPPLSPQLNADSSLPSILKRPLVQEQVELDVRTTRSGEKVVLHRPLQSYQFSGMKHVQVDATRPAVVVHRLSGIVRCVFIALKC